MERPLWQLLMSEPSELTCDECFAVMEYFADLMTQGVYDLLPDVQKFLARCPDCMLEYRGALRQLTSRNEAEKSPRPEIEPGERKKS